MAVEWRVGVVVVRSRVDDPAAAHVVPLAADPGGAEGVLKIVHHHGGTRPEEATPIVAHVETGLLHVLHEAEVC